MQVLLCPDKFKGSLSAAEVCDAIRAGIHRHSRAIEVLSHPLADGGDGTLEVLKQTAGVRGVRLTVKDPLFRPVAAEYGLSADGATAYVEMSQASGLVLLAESERDCLKTTTWGTGELIADALARGATRVVLGLGGSATNDAGTGVAAALGYRFLDEAGRELAPVGENLHRIAAVDAAGVLPALARARVDIASDVQNPFYGPDGAAWVFARQKGAGEAAIRLLDDGLRNVARLVERQWGIDLQQRPGSGAAGGLGGGAMAFLGAELHSGIGMIMEITGLEERIAHADLVITGEGRLDEQTLSGKVIDGVMQLARRHGRRVAVLCGTAELSPERLRAYGIAYCGQVLRNGRSLADAMRNAPTYLEECATELCRALQLK